MSLDSFFHGIPSIWAMALFGILGKGNCREFPEAGNRFGRYADAWKSPQRQQQWTRALKAWEQQRYLDSVEALLEYLLDPTQQNVSWRRTAQRIDFRYLQGSKVVHGCADTLQLRAESKVAHVRVPQERLMRRLLEANNGLCFSAYALDDAEDIALVAFSHMLDGSPYKLLYALRELAIHADKQDDLLLAEFDGLEPVEMEHIQPLGEREKEVRHAFFVQQIRRALDLLDEGALPPKQYPTAGSYVLLGLIYWLDYLVKPEGYTMETFERLHRSFFANDGKSVEHKNDTLRRELEALLARPKEAFFDELYLVPATFGITQPMSHEQFARFVQRELPHMEWYASHGYPLYALAIPDYIVGYSLFNHALPPPVRALLHLYGCVRYHDYFAALGLDHGLVDRPSGRIEGAAIRQAVKAVAAHHKAAFPELDPPVRMLRTDDQQAFARSFLQMMTRLDLRGHTS